MKNQEKDLKNENSDNTERKLTKEELTALCRRAKKHAQKNVKKQTKRKIKNKKYHLMPGNILL